MSIETEIHSFEAGRRGKPDERDTILANEIAAYLRHFNPGARLDLRVSGGYSERARRIVVNLGGEVSASVLTHPGLDRHLTNLVIDHFNKIEETPHSPQRNNNIEVRIDFNKQDSKLASNGHAGDQGTAIAVAYANTPLNLPWERYLAVELRDVIDYIFHHNGEVPHSIAAVADIARLGGLKADGKIEVYAEYEGGRLSRLTNITCATQHDNSLAVSEVRISIDRVVRACLKILENAYELSFGDPKIAVNTLGEFIPGGWYTDWGSREAKPYRDAFSSYGVTEDSLSGEDPSKPSLALTLIARNAACWVVQNHLAGFAKVTASINAGDEVPRLHVYTNRTLQDGMGQKDLIELVNNNVKPLTIHDAISAFKLGQPETYEQIRRNSDYFHSPEYPWNGQVKPIRVNIIPKISQVLATAQV